jgi:hypothetical protein
MKGLQYVIQNFNENGEDINLMPLAWIPPLIQETMFHNHTAQLAMLSMLLNIMFLHRWEDFSYN